jgi:heat shock protein HslJ
MFCMTFLSRCIAITALVTLTACTTLPVSEPATTPVSMPHFMGTEWIVTVVDGVPLVDNPRPRLRWRSANHFSGTGGCNAFQGQSLWSAQNSLRFDGLVPVGTPCLPEPGSQEDLFFKALEQTQTARMEAGQLVLLHDDGRILLRLSRAASSP